MSGSGLEVRPRLQVLSDDQIQELHEATLEVLERTGIKITHPKAQEMLQGAGARIDQNRVRIPASMVDSALQGASSQLVLGRRNGESLNVLQGNGSWFGPNLDCVEYLDPLTAERRPFAIKDCRTNAAILNALPNYAWGMIFGLADDVPPEIADRWVLKEALTCCEKPMVFCCRDLNSLKDIYEMAVLIAGGEGEFTKAPLILMLGDPISPLLIDDGLVEKIIFCAERGIPQICYAAPSAGSTGPATFAGTIVQASAESLAGLVLAQLVQPGTPFVYGAFATVMDMRTTIFSYGAPEMGLMVSAMNQMARFYGLPFFGIGGCSDAKYPDPQAAAEATYSCYTSVLSGADLIHDCGLLDHGSLVSPAFIVLVHELLDMVMQFMGGIRIDRETLALEVIDRVGPGGHYMEEGHTLKHFRNIWYSDLFDRSVYDVWMRKGGKRFEKRLKEQTLKIMEQPPAELPRGVAKELEMMTKHWK